MLRCAPLRTQKVLWNPYPPYPFPVASSPLPTYHALCQLAAALRNLAEGTVVHLKQNVAAMGRDLAAAGMAGLSGTRGMDVP